MQRRLAAGALVFLAGCGSDDPASAVVASGGAPGAATPRTPNETILPIFGVTEPDAGGARRGAGEVTPAQPRLQTDVNVIITADNAYGFGYGSRSALVNYFGGVENITSGDIFNCPVGDGPERYLVPAADSNAGSFLYIVGYADKSTTQGVLAEFFRDGAPPTFTGDGNWEVCATGEDFDPGDGGPSLDEINRQLLACNAGAGDLATTSGGWVGTASTSGGKVVFGENNSTERDIPEPGNEFRIACEIPSEARWMWYDWRADLSMGSPFMWPGGTENVTRDFLIFRLGAEFVPSPIR
jgi:hypothetical protein